MAGCRHSGIILITTHVYLQSLIQLITQQSISSTLAFLAIYSVIMLKLNSILNGDSIV